MKRWGCLCAALTAIVLLGLFAAWNFWWSTATARLQRYFDLSDVSTVEGIRAGILQRFPPGTTMQEVQAYLGRSGMKDSGLDTWYLSDAKGSEVQSIESATAVACSIAYDPSTLEFVKEHYFIWFLFDDCKRLKSVKVHPMLTGL